MLMLLDLTTEAIGEQKNTIIGPPSRIPLSRSRFEKITLPILKHPIHESKPIHHFQENHLTTWKLALVVSEAIQVCLLFIVCEFELS